MLEKRFETKKIESLAQKSVEQIVGEAPMPRKAEFNVGDRFLFHEKVWTVQRAWQESGSQHRHIMSNHGDEEVLQLFTLQGDAETPGFAWVDEPLTKMEQLLLAGKRKAMGWDKDRT